jgi:hypothetical protein
MKSRKVTWAGHVICMESTITEYEFLGGKAEGKKLLGSHKYVQKYDTKMYLKEMEKKWKLVEWIYLAQVGGLW